MPPLPWSACGHAQAAQSPMAGLQRRLHHQLVGAVGLEPGDVLQKVRRLDARRPHHQFRRQQPAVGESHPAGQHLGHFGVGVHLDPQLGQQRFGGLRQPLRQRRQHARRRFDHADADVLVGIDTVQPEGDHLARRAVQLGRQLDTGGTRADDRHLQLLRAQRRCLRMGADAGIDDPGAEALRVGSGLELHRVLGHARRSEVVAEAANRHHQRVVAEHPLSGHLLTLVVDVGGHQHLAPRAVETDHGADAVAEVVPVRLREVADLVGAHIHAAGGDFVKFGFPDVSACAIDQRDLGPPAAAQGVAQARSEFEPARAAADDDDAVQACVSRAGIAHRAVRSRT